MHAPGEDKDDAPARGTSRLPWIVAAGIGGIALAAGLLITVPQLLPRVPIAAETTPPAQSVPSPTATQPSEPSPAPETCDPSTAARIPFYDLALSGTGELTRSAVVEFEREGSDAPTTSSTPLGDGLVAITTDADDGTESRMNLAVVDLESGENRWDLTLDGYLTVVGTPLASGVEDRLVIDQAIGNEHRLISYSLDDGSVLVEREMTTWSYPVTTNAPHEWDDWGVAAQAPGAYLLRDDDTVTRLDPDTLAVEWTIDANAIDAERYEGNHFLTQHIDDTVFVSGHPFDAESGEALDWFSEGDFAVAAGVVLHHEYRFDLYDSYELSAINPRTGEVCWTAEIFDVAADDEELWVVGVDRDVSRLDPVTGEVLERRGVIESTDVGANDIENLGISLVGGAVVTHVSWWSGDTPSVTTAWTPDGPVALPIEDSVEFYAVSGEHVVIRTNQTADDPARLEAYALDGSIAWSVDVEGVTVERGLVTETTIASPGVVQVAIVR